MGIPIYHHGVPSVALRSIVSGDFPMRGGCLCTYDGPNIVQDTLVVQPSKDNQMRCWEKIGERAKQWSSKKIYVALPVYGSDAGVVQQQIMDGIGEHDNLEYLTTEQDIRDLPELLESHSEVEK